MRFFLDHDVDAEVASTLAKLGYQCWTAHGAGLNRASDDDLTVYACNNNACLVTHDREFSVRRRQNVVGRHIWLTCSEWDAASVLADALMDIVPILERHADVMLTLKAAGSFDVQRAWK